MAHRIKNTSTTTFACIPHIKHQPNDNTKQACDEKQTTNTKHAHENKTSPARHQTQNPKNPRGTKPDSRSKSHQGIWARGQNRATNLVGGLPQSGAILKTVFGATDRLSLLAVRLGLLCQRRLATSCVPLQPNLLQHPFCTQVHQREPMCLHTSPFQDPPD